MEGNSMTDYIIIALLFLIWFQGTSYSRRITGNVIEPIRQATTRAVNKFFALFKRSK
jgi:hypothetical protein